MAWDQRPDEFPSPAAVSFTTGSSLVARSPPCTSRAAAGALYPAGRSMVQQHFVVGLPRCHPQISCRLRRGDRQRRERMAVLRTRMPGRAAQLLTQSICRVCRCRWLLHARVHPQLDHTAVCVATGSPSTTILWAHFDPVVATCTDVPSNARNCHRRAAVVFILLAQLERDATDFEGCLRALR
eukprot:COSAG02_NODE_25488_length_657_cov_1.094982_1_plen_182_part_10